MGKILVKNSFTTTSVPAGLSAGELAVNITDKKLFVGNAVGGVVTLVDANALVTSVNGLTGSVQGVSAAVAGTGISVSGATGSVTINYILTSQTTKATPVATDLVQINDGSLSTFPRRATIGAVLDIIAGDVAVSSTGASTYSGTLSAAMGGLGANNSAAVDGQILVAQSNSLGDPITPKFVVVSLGTGTGISKTTGEGTLQINNTGVLSFNGSTGAVGITAGTNVTIVQSGNTYTISSSAGGITGATGETGTQGIQGITGATGDIPTDFVSSCNGLTGTVKVPRSISIYAPTTSDNITLFYTPSALTVSRVSAVLRGSSTPSVTYNLSYGTDRTSATNVFTSGTTVTSTTTATVVTSFNNSSIPTGGMLWLTISAVSGTVDELSVSIEF